MTDIQRGILADVPAHAIYLTFGLTPGAAPPAVRDRLGTLAQHIDGEAAVLGVGQSLASALGAEIPGLVEAPVFNGPGLSIGSAPAALWCWLRGDDRGELLHRARGIHSALGKAFVLAGQVPAFRYDGGRDLTGYEDGTENPVGEAARKTASAGRKELAGSSFVAVQSWAHDLASFAAWPSQRQDNTIGRRLTDNEELDDAPASAHVKRTAQESFTPEAFVLRRSMPWSDELRGGLMFVAFGHSFRAFEAQLKRMLGQDDGIVDALFDFSSPRATSYFWCPPCTDGKLDLTRLDQASRVSAEPVGAPPCRADS